MLPSPGLCVDLGEVPEDAVDGVVSQRQPQRGVLGVERAADGGDAGGVAGLSAVDPTGDLASTGADRSDAAFVWLPLPDPGRYEWNEVAIEPRLVALLAGHPLAARDDLAFADRRRGSRWVGGRARQV